MCFIIFTNEIFIKNPKNSIRRECLKLEFLGIKKMFSSVFTSCSVKMIKLVKNEPWRFFCHSHHYNNSNCLILSKTAFLVVRTSFLQVGLCINQFSMYFNTIWRDLYRFLIPMQVKWQFFPILTETLTWSSPLGQRPGV